MTASSYRPDIDGLRAIAVLSVLFCHSGLLMPGGYVGVDVFFVISGYLITGIIVKDLDQQRFSLVEFWERRVRRILPALAALVAAVLVAGWFLLLPTAMKALAASAVAVVAMAANIQFWRVTGYFEPAADELPLLHTWSLAVEEQFYLIVPLFLVALYRLRLQRYVFAILSLCAVISFAASVYGVKHHPSATFFLLPTRAWELLVGSLLALYAKNRSTSTSNVMALIGIAAILLPCFVLDATTPFPGLAAVGPVSGTALLIANGGSRINAVLKVRPLVFIGQISYSLYLWHWPLFAYARCLSIRPLTTAERLFIVALSLLLGFLSWRFIETPFRRRTILARRSRLFLSAAGAYSVLLLAGLAIFLHDGVPGRLPAEAARFVETGTRQTRFMLSHTEGDVPHNLTKLGRLDAQRRVLIWGDSHAMALLPAIEALAKERDVEVTVATHSSTAPVLGYYFQSRYGLNQRSIPFNEAVVKFVEEEQIDAVILAGVWSSYNEHPDFRGALEATVARLQAAGAKVYFAKDVPDFGVHVPTALALYTWQGWATDAISMPLSNYQLLNSFYDEMLPALEASGVTVIDPLPYFNQSDGLLRPFGSSGSMYSDGAHLSTVGAMAVRNMFVTVFDSLGKPSSDVGADMTTSK